MASAIRGWMSQPGPIVIPFEALDEIGNNPFFAPNAGIVPQLEACHGRTAPSGDPVGAQITVTAAACRRAGAN